MTRSGSRPSSKRLLAVSAVALGAALLAAVPALAGPIQAKEAEARQVLAEIQSLDSKLERAVEAYDGANVKLDQIRGEIRVNRHELRIGRHNLREAQERLAARLHQIYVSGDTSSSTLEVVLGATSLDDLINRIDTVNRV